MKIIVDTALVVAAVALCYLFFGAWLWNVVGVGTLFAMFYVGLVVKTVARASAGSTPSSTMFPASAATSSASQGF